MRPRAVFYTTKTLSGLAMAPGAVLGKAARLFLAQSRQCRIELGQRLASVMSSTAACCWLGSRWGSRSSGGCSGSSYPHCPQLPALPLAPARAHDMLVAISTGADMSNDPTHVVAEAIAEAQAILHDHLESNVGDPADVLTKVNRVLSNRTLVRALYDVGFFPRENPPEVGFTLLDQQAEGNRWGEV